MPNVKIVVFVPVDHADRMRHVLGDAGAGKQGSYEHCSFSSRGTGRFTPTAGADPFIGAVGTPEAVEEERIEMLCDRSLAKQVLAAMRAAHPYEEPAYDLVPLLDEADL